jgi:NitT/TauT family transport system permease protein
MPTTTEIDAPRANRLDEELAGLDALELPKNPQISFARRAWTATWPKVMAVVIAMFLWQCVVWSGWKPEFVLPGPVAVFQTLGEMWSEGQIGDAVARTMQRAAIGYAMAVTIGVTVGAIVARSRILRSAVGSLITGLQTMPSIAWFPLALLLFKLSEGAILFVVVIGAAPSIANGLIAGTDQIPPILMRAGRVLGARGFSLYRHVAFPASVPSFISGLKQGWAFSWRSLMAGEIIVVIAGQPSIGSGLNFGRQFSDSEVVMAWMVVILFIGILIDAVFFGTVERWVRRRWGLEDTLGA